MKTLKELNLKPKDLYKVKTWLNEWAHHFQEMAQGDRASVERYDLEKIDFFYFTDCRDILSKKPESLGVETAESIRKRKRAVEYELLFRFLGGEELGRKRPCSHCGNDDRWINTLGDGTGHYVYCPKCKMTSVITYPAGYETCIGRVVQDLIKQGFIDDADAKLTPTEWEKAEKTEKRGGKEPKLSKIPPLKTVPECCCKKKKD